MKKSENVYIILDWFNYDTNDLSHSEDAFPIGVTTSLDNAIEKAKQRAKEAKQEFVNDDFEKNSLTISKFADNEHTNVKYALGIYDEAQGLLEKIEIFKEKLL